MTNMTNIWIDIVVGGFGLLGAVTFVRWVVRVSKEVVATVTSLTEALRDAAEIARAYREDLQVIRQIAQSAPQQQDDVESLIPPERRDQRVELPQPYMGRFTSRPVEVEAPPEQIDMTASEEEVIDQELRDGDEDFEASERFKAASREAEQTRIRELADLGIPSSPEGK